MSQTSVHSSPPNVASTGKRRNAANSWDRKLPMLGPGDRIAEGDTELVLDILPPDLAAVAFEKLRNEVQWNVMHHRGGEVPRLVAVQGEVESDGSHPIYRHPADSSPPTLPFTPTISLIRDHVSKALKQPLNHVLIQHYRTGADYISEHSDKTIDVVRGSKIVNISLGAERKMTLRTKKDALPAHAAGDDGEDETKRATQRVPLPHNSMFAMGLETNAKWTHSIRADKRHIMSKSPSEQFNNGERISLTFRHIGTFLAPIEGDSKWMIWGQGAKAKTKEEAHEVICGGPEGEALIDAFGKENRQSEFEWDQVYGEGSDVLHFIQEGQGEEIQENK